MAGWLTLWSEQLAWDLPLRMQKQMLSSCVASLVLALFSGAVVAHKAPWERAVISLWYTEVDPCYVIWPYLFAFNKMQAPMLKE